MRSAAVVLLAALLGFNAVAVRGAGEALGGQWAGLRLPPPVPAPTTPAVLC